MARKSRAVPHDMPEVAYPEEYLRELEQAIRRSESQDCLRRTTDFRQRRSNVC